ncbi:GPW/gp25 family protein [Enterovibrio makurazakiensis]|uniref:GPW/gp25 family protein n=1 Tax=Enterovibrio gelatinilyticus TaxID=2899819 RepID=A0ABT5QZD0_9GAMM|nr:GPW/gp25 family protein [Enterovibrio sp. ZSDZ42]MDD1793366.1 GPW/gp25 family protein [Enterovibrio sp. ZSDZ42]
MNYPDFPYRIDTQGRSATTHRIDVIRDRIEQVLFTEPGERVMMPTFGCGLNRLLFLGISDAVIEDTRTLIATSLQNWMQDDIELNDVTVQFDQGALFIDVSYSLLPSGDLQQASFVREGAA